VVLRLDTVGVYGFFAAVSESVLFVRVELEGDRHGDVQGQGAAEVGLKQGDELNFLGKLLLDFGHERFEDIMLTRGGIPYFNELETHLQRS
jgi:hypothetical protein